MHPGIWLAAGNFVLVLVVMGLALKRMRAAETAISRSPFSEKLIRPAGETLRLKIDGLREKIDELALTLALLSVIPGTLAVLVLQRSEAGWWILAFVTMMTWGASFYRWKDLMKLRRKMRALRLGFDGERYVAEELNQLMRDGYRIYHDFIVSWKPEDRIFNIDHIAVGPEGVFAIETKTRRKRLKLPDGTPVPKHEVIYDGYTLKYPDWESARQVRQAAGAAEELAKWLRGSSAERVEVIPVIVIPGWWVEHFGEGYAVKVLSGKQVRWDLPRLGRSGSLSPKRVEEIGDVIERHCRNLEGA